MTGYFVYHRGSRDYFLALHRLPTCQCTVNGGDENTIHDWLTTCDRFPPVVAEQDGEDVDIDLVANLVNDRDTAPIQPKNGLTPAQEYAYQVAAKGFTRDHKNELNTLAPIF